ncbi:MAG: VCBS repeat-containing protein, partial [Planctomycetes bacterium]|nr:VCBS repeat-containing protein [Planctomycetota bacterium]
DLDGDLDVFFSGNLSSRTGVFLQTNGVTSVSPTQNAVNNLATTDVSVTNNFTSVLAPASGNFVVNSGFSGALAGAYSGAATSTHTLNPTNSMHPNEVITVTHTAAHNSAGSSQRPFVSQFRTSANAGPLRFHSESAVGPTMTTTSAAAVGDIDNDGDLDLVMGDASGSLALQAWVNNGSGIFSAGGSMALHPVHDIELVDLNLDGNLDVIQARNGFNCQFFLGTGGSFVSQTSFGTSGLNAITTGDVNGDGYPDVIMMGGAGTNTQALFWNSAGTNFTGGSSTIGAVGNNHQGGQLADVDNDGDLDLVVYEATGGTIQFFANDGIGNFRLAQSLVPSALSSSLALGDLNGDGYVDLVSQSGEVFINAGLMLFNTSPLYMAPEHMFRPRLADLDGDGDLDVIYLRSTGMTEARLNAGNGAFS